MNTAFLKRVSLFLGFIAFYFFSMLNNMKVHLFLCCQKTMALDCATEIYYSSLVEWNFKEVLEQWINFNTTERGECLIFERLYSNYNEIPQIYLYNKVPFCHIFSFSLCQILAYNKRIFFFDIPWTQVVNWRGHTDFWESKTTHLKTVKNGDTCYLINFIYLFPAFSSFLFVLNFYLTFITS